MTDQAIDWVKQQKALMPDKPFFIYFAPGATHAPHHVRPEWSDKYKGKFDDGWDALRERTFVRQKELGVIPPEAELTERPEEIPAWDDMPDDLKPVLARQMEVYAGFLEHTDHHVGRLIDALERPRDPGRHARLLHRRRQRGVRRGHAERLLQRARRPERRSWAGDDRVHGLPDRRLRHASAYNHYAVGWAHAMDTPYQWTKQVASHWGGTRNGTIVHWPEGSRQRERCALSSTTSSTSRRRSWTRRTPGADERQRRPAGAAARRLHAVLVRRADAAERRTTQYFEMFVNRGIYHQGWTAVTRHSTPWMPRRCSAFDDDVWELYGPDDWSQADDLADEKPDKLAELQRLFLMRGEEVQRPPPRRSPGGALQRRLAGRPQLVRGKSQLLFGRMGRLSENSVVVTRTSRTRSRRRSRSRGGRQRRDRRPGRRVRRLRLYAKDGKPAYCYNLFGLQQFKVYGKDSIPPASIRCGWSSRTTGAGSARAATSSSTSTASRSARVASTPPCPWSSRPTRPRTSARTPRRPSATTTGQGQRVHRDGQLGADRRRGRRRGHRPPDHPEERLRVAMARQ